MSPRIGTTTSAAKRRLPTTGSLPHITVLRSEHAIGKSPLYFGVAGDYATIVRSTTNNDVKVSDQGLTRMDVSPDPASALYEMAIPDGELGGRLARHLLDGKS